nr:MAG TPA: hypothetical protein [Caudoviricetes sp.]
MILQIIRRDRKSRCASARVQGAKPCPQRGFNSREE